ncbi:MAG: hypothetical protein Q9208_004897 [Pyrenodesmia sp. 3 TL-2023]
MVHYIRFLKPPQFDYNIKIPKRAALSASIAITTDLGDAFYPGNLSVSVGIVTQIKTIKLRVASWTPGMRCLKIEIKIPLEYLTSRARLLFTSSDSLEMDSFQHGQVPYVVSAWTEDFAGPKEPLSDAVVRCFRLPSQKVKLLEIREDNGESMARHIWDAAIALTAWLLDHKEQVLPPGKKQYSVLELGTGCGMVGLVLASMSQSQNCRLILTDVDDDSLRLAKYNASKSREGFNSVWETRILDWKEPQNFTLNQKLGLIVASDCIYNADHIPDLVRTMSDLVKHSQELCKESAGPKILISTKTRHSSEKVFFKLMNKAGFKQMAHETVPMRDGFRELIGQEVEVVHIHVFERHDQA